ncbi:MAG: zinc ABC transporter substrate-binding protein [Sulfuricurvum sp.]|nr:zinc ABC transporter substrate-binding protein [Sulfuricurvum sp.]
METKRLIVLGGTLAAIVIGMSFFSPNPKLKVIEQQQKPIISVSTFTLYEIVHAIAGDALEVHSIIPLGTDAHVFNPNPQQVAEISNSALFVYNGAGFESWANQLRQTLSAKTDVLDMSQHVVLLKGGEEPQQQDADDPHYWLDIENMIRMTQVMEGRLSKLSPSNGELFHKNTADYIAKLQELKSEYKIGLSECKNRTLISNHNAFGYLAHLNNLDNVSVIGLSSDEQPSAKNIADIIDVVKKHGVRTIFFEDFINDNVSQTIAHETGIKAVSLQPLENISEDELKSHQTYLSIMQDNLVKLREAMECR